jgi:isocitrate lyase
MKAYVELIQRKERELGTDVLTHQKVCVFPVRL